MLKSLCFRRRQDKDKIAVLNKIGTHCCYSYRNGSNYRNIDNHKNKKRGALIGASRFLFIDFYSMGVLQSLQ